MSRTRHERLNTIIAFARKHRRYGLLAAATVMAPVFITLNRCAMALDPLLFPSLRGVRVEAPVVIIAHPRSGTTFLHRLLALEPQAAQFRTWEMPFPSITLRRLVRPFVRAAESFGLGRLQAAGSGHEITLTGVDEEEGLFLHHLDSEMLTYLCPEGLIDPEFREEFVQLGWCDAHGNREPVEFLKECFRRQLCLSGAKKILINSNPSVFRIRTILEVFPDARFVFLYRSPEETIPSYLSLFARTAAFRISRDRQSDFYRQKYRWSRHLYSYFEHVRGEIPEGQLFELPFDRFTKAPEESVRQVLRFAGITPSGRTMQAVQREVSKPKKRPHSNYPVEHFGISRAELQRDFGG